MGSVLPLGRNTSSLRPVTLCLCVPCRNLESVDNRGHPHAVPSSPSLPVLMLLLPCTPSGVIENLRLGQGAPLFPA